RATPTKGSARRPHLLRGVGRARVVAPSPVVAVAQVLAVPRPPAARDGGAAPGGRHGRGARVTRRVFLHPRVAVVAATMSAAVLSGIVTAQQAPPQQPNFDAINVRSFKVQDNVYMLAGAGGNVTVQFGNDGVLVVDTQFAQMADKLLAEIARLSGSKPIRYVIDTHVHPDHVGGNERFRRAGRAIVAGNVAGDVQGNEGA